MHTQDNPPTPAPAIFKSPIDGKELTAVWLDGRPMCLAIELGQLLGYANDGRRLTASIREHWNEQLIEGEDFIKLTGDRLRAFKTYLATSYSRSNSWNRVNSLMLLTKSGADFCIGHSDTQYGKELRRWLFVEVWGQLQETGQYTATNEDTRFGAATPEAPQVEPPPANNTAALNLDPIKVAAELRRIGSARLRAVKAGDLATVAILDAAARPLVAGLGGQPLTAGANALQPQPQPRAQTVELVEVERAPSPSDFAAWKSSQTLAADTGIKQLFISKAITKIYGPYAERVPTPGETLRVEFKPREASNNTRASQWVFSPDAQKRIIQGAIYLRDEAQRQLRLLPDEDGE